MKRFEIKQIPGYKTRQRWRVFCNTPYLNCDRIHPLQQDKIADILEKLKDDENVESVTIFGSSVTDRCHQGSDVDVYVETREDRKLPVLSEQFAYDVWTNYTVSPEMSEEIKKKGVKVYERHAVSAGNS